MRTWIYGLLMFALAVNFGDTQQSSPANSWQGKLETYSFNYLYGVGAEGGSDVSRRGYVEKYEYDLYQNPAGVAREELGKVTRTMPLTIVGSPYNIRILDYSRGSATAFFKGGQEGAEGPLVPVAGVSLPQQRTILGFTCEGKHYRWTTFQNATVELDTWTARGADFRVPLLEVSYFIEPKGSLLGMTVVMVTELKPVTGLPASLFEVPQGLHLTHALSMWGL